MKIFNAISMLILEYDDSKILYFQEEKYLKLQATATFLIVKLKKWMAHGRYYIW